jgi:hypothetical protein
VKVLVIAALLIMAHWKPEYAELSPQIQHWFQGLRAPQSRVPCCELSDGMNPNADDIEWDTKGEHYTVRIEGKWYVVPDEAVITEPNKYGRAVVWYYPVEGAHPSVVIRCFLPGGGT